MGVNEASLQVIDIEVVDMETVADRWEFPKSFYRRMRTSPPKVISLGQSFHSRAGTYKVTKW